jgi:hypothetical protein
MKTFYQEQQEELIRNSKEEKMQVDRDQKQNEHDQ